MKLKQIEYELMDVKQAAELCGCSETYIRQLMEDGKLTFIEIGASKKKLTTREYVEPFRVPVDCRNPRKGVA